MLKINKFAKIVSIFLVLMFVGNLNVNAAYLSAEISDYSKEFVDWINLSDEEKENNMMPVPFDVPESKNNVIHFANLLTGFAQN